MISKRRLGFDDDRKNQYQYNHWLQLFIDSMYKRQESEVNRNYNIRFYLLFLEELSWEQVV